MKNLSLKIEKKLIFLEIPLLIESNLVNTFDTIIFIKQIETLG